MRGKTRDWQARVKGLLKAELTRRDLTYADLAKKLAAIGIKDNERNISNKIARGSFTAVFFFQCLEAIGCHTLYIGDLLQRPLSAVKKPKWADKTFGPGDRVPATTPFHAHHVGHAGEHLIEPSEGERFPLCGKCGDKVRYTLA